MSTPTTIQSLLRRVHQNPLDATAWLQLGLAMDREQRVEQAEECYARVLDLQPELIRQDPEVARLVAKQRSKSLTWLNVYEPA